MTVQIQPSDFYPGCTHEQIRSMFDYREDGHLVWKLKPNGRVKVGDTVGALRPDGYLHTKIRGQQTGVHRAVYFWHHGWCPEFLDHIDRDPLNNRIENLRPASQSQNNANRRKASGSSRWKGVSWKRNRWEAGIGKDGKWTYLGRFKSEMEAALAYNHAAKEVFGDYALLNEV